MRKPNYCDIIIAGASLFLAGHFWTLAAADGMVKAAIKNDITLAEVSLAMAPWAVNRPNVDNRLFAALCEYPVRPPLLWACTENNAELVGLYLEHGANIHAVSNGDTTALTATLCYGPLTDDRFDIAQMLIDHGFDLTAPQDASGNDALTASLKIGSRESAAVKDASYALFLQTVEAFEAKGMDIRSRSYWDRNLLTKAASENHLPALQYLLENGYYKVNDTDDYGRTALTAVLSFSGYDASEYEICAYLLAKGADPTIKDASGKSAMDYAEESGDRALIDLLEGCRT